MVDDIFYLPFYFPQLFDKLFHKSVLIIMMQDILLIKMSAAVQKMMIRTEL